MSTLEYGQWLLVGYESPADRANDNCDDTRPLARLRCVAPNLGDEDSDGSVDRRRVALAAAIREMAPTYGYSMAERERPILNDGVEIEFVWRENVVASTLATLAVALDEQARVVRRSIPATPVPAE
jgi:hypothetical protein